MGISTIDVLSSCLVLPWEQRNLFVSRACSFSSHSNFATFRSLSFSANLSDSVFSKGCLSISTLQRPNRHSVVCMANKYAAYSNNSKDKKQEVSEKKVSRKEISRKKRGNSGRKRKRMSKGGKKKASEIVRLVSAAGTGFFYAKKKSRMIIDKLQLLKFDPRVKRHVLFEEVK